MKVLLPRAWNQSHGLGHMRWNFDFDFFILCDWTLNPELFYEGLVAESLKSEPKAWLIWAEIENSFLIIW